LRETIARLKRRPLQRLRSWVHLVSSKSALGRALAAYIAGFALLLVALHGSDQSAWADGLTTETRIALAWYPFDERFFYANAVAAGFAAAAAPLFYLTRWFGLRWEYGCEYCAFKELARSDPDQPIDPIDANEVDGDSASSADTTGICADIAWFAVLGLSSSATIEEVKEAYKRLVKQNHPDRVHGMSQAFRKLAEAETKRLNAAFRQALVAVSRTGNAAN
jgi:DnaJ domain